MTDTELVEKVAQAICRANGKTPGTAMDWDDGGVVPQWKFYIEDAEAAIAAIREYDAATKAAFEAECG